MSSGTKLVVLVLGMWVCAAVATIITGNTDPFGAAAFTSILFGGGYLFLK